MMLEMSKSESPNICRHCATPLSVIMADLGATPISNDFLNVSQVNGPEPFYPLRAFVCGECKLVQLQDFFKSDDLFREDYTYFSSFSTSWLEHASRYAKNMIKTESLTEDSLVVEIASNDGYLLQFFKEDGIAVLGVEPSESVANVAIREKEVPTEILFFGVETATMLKDKGQAADLMVANNVLAHVPDINDFVAGFQVLLKDTGVATFEFPHLLNLIQLNQFDTIYHEHFSYLSLLAAERILKSHGLRVFNIEKLATHGGSLRLYVCHEKADRQEDGAVQSVRTMEVDAGLHGNDVYTNYAKRVWQTKRSLLSKLMEIKSSGKTIAGYGAPAKGNTLLNYCGVGSDIIDFTVDRSPHKQKLFLPGTRIPILAPEAITEYKPDYVLILPWNLKDEIIEQMSHIREWGGKFIVPIPVTEIID